jgi:ATP-dependent Clp protease ATP-binding subunit ClpA
MLERLTAKARHVVLFAEFAARKAGNAEAGLEHLFIALVQTEPELWRTIAGRRTDTTIALLAKAIFYKRTIDVTPLPPTTKIVLGEDLKKALRLAVAEAKEARSELMGTDHLLLGLLKADGEGRPFEILRRRGINYETARARMLEEAANPRGEEPPNLFSRYSDKTRRVIFFARFEAGADGAELTGPEHLLMALVREDKPMWRKIAGTDFDSGLAVQMRSAVGVGKPALIDLQLSEPAKAALSAAETEAGLAKSIETSHILLGLLKTGANHPVFDILKQHDITYEIARAKLFEETSGGAGA